MDYAQLIDDYLAGPQKLRAAVAGMTAEQLDAHSIPGTWSIKEVVCHEPRGLPTDGHPLGQSTSSIGKAAEADYGSHPAPRQVHRCKTCGVGVTPTGREERWARKVERMTSPWQRNLRGALL